MDLPKKIDRKGLHVFMCCIKVVITMADIDSYIGTLVVNLHSNKANTGITFQSGKISFSFLFAEAV